MANTIANGMWEGARLYDRAIGVSNGLGKTANLAQKLALAWNHFVPEYIGVSSDVLRVSSAYKTAFSFFLAPRHTAFGFWELPDLYSSAAEYWVGKRSFTSFVFGSSLGSLTDRVTYAGPGGRITTKDHYVKDQSLASAALRWSKALQKYCDLFGALTYFASMKEYPAAKEKFSRFNKLKSTFQVVEYTIGLGWNSYNLYHTAKDADDLASKRINTLIDSFAVAAASLSAISYHLLDKNSVTAHKIQGFVCFFAVAAAVMPYFRDHWFDGEYKISRASAAPAA